MTAVLGLFGQLLGKIKKKYGVRSHQTHAYNADPLLVYLLFQLFPSFGYAKSTTLPVPSLMAAQSSVSGKRMYTMPQVGML